jgi:hypothetical protein
VACGYVEVKAFLISQVSIVRKIFLPEGGEWW